MLTIHCAACRKKLWRYDKIGPGEVLRCHKNRIKKMYNSQVHEHKIQCPCGKNIGIDKGRFYKMITKALPTKEQNAIKLYFYWTFPLLPALKKPYSNYSFYS